MPDRIVVLGAGTMGHGIAQVAALAGFQVSLYDIRADLVDHGLARIRENLAKGVEKGKVTAADRDAAMARLRGTSDLAQGCAEVSLAIEAVPERIDLKREVFGSLDRLCPADAILATNTSSLSVSEIARATRRPAQVCGMHFFNPVHIMKLLELVRGEQTSEATVAAVRAIGARLGKDCILVKDSPGFASSRLGICVGLEAIRMLEQEVASAEDIDKAMKLGYGFPMGPLELTDQVGLDVRLDIATYLHRELGTEAFRPPDLLKRLVAEGKLGKKAKEGFYRYP